MAVTLWSSVIQLPYTLVLMLVCGAKVASGVAAHSVTRAQPGRKPHALLRMSPHRPRRSSCARAAAAPDASTVPPRGVSISHPSNHYHPLTPPLLPIPISSTPIPPTRKPRLL